MLYLLEVALHIPSPWPWLHLTIWSAEVWRTLEEPTSGGGEVEPVVPSITDSNLRHRRQVSPSSTQVPLL